MLVTKEISKTNISFDTIIITGGLSHYIPENTVKSNIPIFIPKEKEFTNAIAMHHITNGNTLDLGFGDAKLCLVREKNT